MPVATAIRERVREVGRTVAGPVGEVLAFPHGVDRYLELVDPLWSVDQLRGKVVRVDRTTADSVTLTLKPGRQFTGAIAGQFVNLSVEIDGVRHTRCYSVASSDHRTDGLIELTVKAVGLVSGHLQRNARVGLVVGLSQAMGEFTLPEPRPDSLLLISGGSGITPVMGMLRTLCDEGHDRPVTFLHYAFTPADVIYRAELEVLAARHPNIDMVVAYTEHDGGRLSGFFGREHLEAVLPGFANTETYVCGPPGLMAAVARLYESEGLDDRLHIESFALVGAQMAADPGEVEGTLTFIRSGRTAANDGTTLLEQAEAAGLSPRHGCRMGICHTCTRHKDYGVVRNVVSGQVSSPGAEDIQICVSSAVGDVALDL